MESELVLGEVRLPFQPEEDEPLGPRRPVLARHLVGMGSHVAGDVASEARLSHGYSGDNGVASNH